MLCRLIVASHPAAFCLRFARLRIHGQRLLYLWMADGVAASACRFFDGVRRGTAFVSMGIVAVMCTHRSTEEACGLRFHATCLPGCGRRGRFPRSSLAKISTRLTLRSAREFVLRFPR